MDENAIAEIRKTILEAKARAKKAQAVFAKELAPLYRKDERKPPQEVVDSSFLFMRSCDADQGFRPLPCPVFWLSPDIRVLSMSAAGQVTRELVAGYSYRLVAMLRNRGDLAVPAAKVEFFLTDPTLGFDTRFATKLGVAQARVEAHGAVELGIDYRVPPGLSGHHCLFARAFSFAPLDLPVSDYALDPVIDRHIAQANLTFIAGGAQMQMNVIHFPNADDRILIQPMTAIQLRDHRIALPAGLRFASPRLAAEFTGKFALTLEPADAKGVKIAAERTEDGIILISRSADHPSTEAQVESTKALMDMRAAEAKGRNDPARRRKLELSYRQMTTTALRSRLTLDVPDMGLKGGLAAAFLVRRVSRVTGMTTGGIALFVTRPTEFGRLR